MRWTYEIRRDVASPNAAVPKNNHWNLAPTRDQILITAWYFMARMTKRNTHYSIIMACVAVSFNSFKNIFNFHSIFKIFFGVGNILLTLTIMVRLICSTTNVMDVRWVICKWMVIQYAKSSLNHQGMSKWETQWWFSEHLTQKQLFPFLSAVQPQTIPILLLLLFFNNYITFYCRYSINTTK